MGKFIDITGVRFGRLVVTGIYCGGKTSKWNCRCDCGKTTIVSSQNLRRGRIKSCGCYNSELTIARNTKHGQSNTRVYKIWKGMKKRCYNQNSEKYPAYGGRGITICPEWHDFVTFRNWALSNGYGDNLSIDRIDVNINYEPSNCRWSTAKEQANNKTDNHILQFRGVRKTVAEWADVVGIDKRLLYDRISRYGWSAERALTESRNRIPPPDDWRPEEEGGDGSRP
jgi:hypothetical protein